MRRRNTPSRRINPPEPEPINTHEHEWVPLEECPVHLEDEAAIFTQECEWVEITGSSYSEKQDETFYSEGAKCEACRTVRMEMVWLEKRREGGANIRYLPAEFENLLYLFEPGIIEVELEGEIVDVYYWKDDGYVVAESDNWRAKYEA